MALTKAHNRMIAGSSANVDDFGAVGDGVADDSAAIQAAINSSATDIVLTNGKTYLCMSTITFPSNKRLSGHAKLKLGTRARRLIRTVKGATNCIFEYFEAEGFSGKSGGYVGGEFAIQLDDAKWSVIRNVTAYNFGGDGFYVGPDDANHNLVENCVGHDNGRQGVSLAGGSYNTVRGGSYYDNVLYGVDFEGPAVSDGLADGVTAWGNVNGITSVVDTLGKNTITNCRCYSNTENGIQAGAVYDKVTSNTCYLNGKNGIFGASNYSVFDGNVCFENTENGISIDPGLTRVGVVVSNNTSHKNVRSGIVLNRVANSSVCGNACVDNDSGDTTTYMGIFVTGAVSARGDGNTIIGNTCGNTVAGTGQRFGVLIAANCSDNIVSANSFDGNKTAPISDAGTGNKFYNNSGYTNKNGGTSSAILSGGTIAHGLAGTPTVFSATPTASATDVVVTANATNLTVTFGGGGSVAFAWQAALQNGV
jgi:hypothetical protein